MTFDGLRMLLGWELSRRESTTALIHKNDSTGSSELLQLCTGVVSSSGWYTTHPKAST